MKHVMQFLCLILSIQCFGQVGTIKGNIQNEKKESIDLAFETFRQHEGIHKLSVISNDLDDAWTKFKSRFKITKAAGGLVENENGEFLLIYRRGFWDLPKGKLDEGESLKECAVREVQEECGLGKIKLLDKICVTHHIYRTKKASHLKPSHWYHMKVKGTPVLVPQEDEDIEKAEWVSKSEFNERLKQAYPSINVVAKKFFD